jgi:hypothetical protein
MKLKSVLLKIVPKEHAILASVVTLPVSGGVQLHASSGPEQKVRTNSGFWPAHTPGDVCL